MIACWSRCSRKLPQNCFCSHSSSQYWLARNGASFTPLNLFNKYFWAFSLTQPCARWWGYNKIHSLSSKTYLLTCHPNLYYGARLLLMGIKDWSSPLGSLASTGECRYPNLLSRPCLVYSFTFFYSLRAAPTETLYITNLWLHNKLPWDAVAEDSHICDFMVSGA